MLTTDDINTGIRMFVTMRQKRVELRLPHEGNGLQAELERNSGA